MQVPLRLFSRSLAALALAGFAALAAHAAEKQPAMLMHVCYFQQSPQWQQMFVKEMEAKGYRVQFLEEAEDLTWDLLRQFNVFVTGGFYYDYALRVSPDTVKRWGELLAGFAETGGGVLILSSVGGGYLTEEESEAQWRTLVGSFGLDFLVEQVLDPAHSYRQPRRLQSPFAWTTRITPHAATEGITTVYYPAGAVGYNPGTAPLRPQSDAWQVLVRGMDTAGTRAANWALHATYFYKDLPGSFPSAPPIVAVRDFGKGRVAAMGLHYLPCLLWQGHPLLDDIMLSRGDGQTPSDTGKLLTNLYRWLAEPSLASGQVGGWDGETAMVTEFPPGSLGSDRPFDWSRVRIPETPLSFPGVIGAHSAYSDGAGTVKEWVAAAKTAGLKWIVFTENFERLDQAKWERLVTECKQASSANFWVVPGLEVTDVGGNHWVQFHPNLPWLPPDLLDPTGKRVRVAQNFFFGSRGTGPPTGPCMVGKEGHPAWSLRYLNLFAVCTAEKGKPVDQALEAYLVKQEQEDEVMPMVVNRMFSPAEVGAQNSSVPLTYLYGPDTAAARHWFEEPVWRTGKSYVSAGPRLLCWEAMNGNRASLGSYYLPGTERWRVRLKVQAEAGLKEVRIYDGTQLYARYLPREKEFDLSLEGLHDQSRRLVAIVTDQKGGQLVTPSLLLVDFLGRTQMCSDRNNTMPQVILQDTDGTPYLYPGAVMVDKGRPPSLAIHPSVPYYKVGLPASDGGTSWKGWDLPLQPAILDWSPGAGYYSRTVAPLVGMHFIVQRWDSRHEFLPIEGHLRAILNVTPYLPYRELDLFDMDVRQLALIRRPDDMGLVLLEGCLTAKKAFTLAPDQPMSLPLAVVYATPKPGENDHLLLARPRQAGEGMLLPDPDKPFRYNDALPAGSVFACYPDYVGAQGIVFLDDGYSLQVEASRQGVRAQAYLSLPGRKLAPGDKLPFRLLCVLGGFNAPPESGEFQGLQESLGLTGAPAYRVELTQGTVTGTKLFLDLQAQEGGCLGQIRKTAAETFPCRLPVRVYGLNPNWSTAVYDRQRRELIPFGLMDGVGYTTLDLDRGPADVYVGNLVTCDQSELRLWVVEEGADRVKVTAQNPTGKAITTTVMSGAGYNRVPAFTRAVTVPAGGQVEFVVDG